MLDKIASVHLEILHPTEPEPFPGHGNGLSERESEVMILVAKGLPNPGIASALFISTDTVKSHLRSVFSKLGVHSRVELANHITEHMGQSRLSADPTDPRHPNDRMFAENR